MEGRQQFRRSWPGGGNIFGISGMTHAMRERERERSKKARESSGLKAKASFKTCNVYFGVKK
jgi:hypothetical protein